MDVAVGDFDLDGHLDIFKSPLLENTNGLHQNDGVGRSRM
jgi:hypothetical protein